jgi:hypothetical protein
VCFKLLFPQSYTFYNINKTLTFSSYHHRKNEVRRVIMKTTFAVLQFTSKGNLARFAKLFFVLAGLLLMQSGAAFSCHLGCEGKNCPPGNYKDSCVNCVVSPYDILICQCDSKTPPCSGQEQCCQDFNHNNTFHQTTNTTGPNCTRFTNKKGTLVCY